MATVRDYMTRRVLTLSPEMDVHKAIRLLVRRRVSGAPVVDSAGRLAGILSEKDCFRVAFSAEYHSDRAGSVADYMTGEVESVEAGADIASVAASFLNRPYRRYPVVEGDRVVGIISRRDVLKALAQRG